MAKHEKNKAGLHKGISSIFKGVSIPQTDGGQKPSGPPAPERTDFTEPKQPAPEPQKVQAPKAYQATQTLPKAAPEHTATEPKQPAPETQKTQAQKPYQVTPSLPKAATAQKPKTEPAHLPKFMTAQQSNVEPAQRSKAEPVQKPKVVPAQKPKAEPAQRSKTELTQKPKTVPAHLPEFMTDQQSNVEPAQRPKAEPVQKPKVVPVQQPKVVPVRQPKADIDKKVSKKSPAVKISSQSFWQQIRNKLFKPKPGVSTTKQKAMVVMMLLLFIVLIFMLFRGGVFGTSASHTEASAEDTAPGVGTAGTNTKIDWDIPEPYPTTLRDPMRLVPEETAQTDQTETRKTIKLIIKGILYTEDNPSAVIGNSIVHEGETIRGVSVIKISQDSVEFEMNGKRWTQKVR